MKEQRSADRRKNDHSTPCDLLHQHINVAALLHQDVQEIKSQLATMVELLEVFNNTKGFVRTLQMIGMAAKWITVVGAAVAVVGSLFYYGTRK